MNRNIVFRIKNIQSDRSLINGEKKIDNVVPNTIPTKKKKSDSKKILFHLYIELDFEMVIHICILTIGLKSCSFINIFRVLKVSQV